MPNHALRHAIEAYLAERDAAAPPNPRTPSKAAASPSEAKLYEAKVGHGHSCAGLPKSILDPKGLGVWEPKTDANTGLTFWVNHTLRETTWKVPVLLCSYTL
jgi:hypothetical protein